MNNMNLNLFLSVLIIISCMRLTDHQSTEYDLDFDLDDLDKLFLTTTVPPNRVRFRVKSTFPTPVVTESKSESESESESEVNRFVTVKSNDVNKQNGEKKKSFQPSKPLASQIETRSTIPQWLLSGRERVNARAGEASRQSSIQDIDSSIDYEYASYDGWNNNLGHPELGSVDSPLIRILQSNYSDGSFHPSGTDRPNPIVLSEAFMKGDKFGSESRTGKTAFLVYFGQQVVEEIIDAQRAGCPPEYHNIDIPEEVYAPNGSKIAFNDSTGHSFMPFLRARYDITSGQSTNYPRQQLNEITPWIDGNIVYGTSRAWSDALRSFHKGKLLASEGEFPAINDINLPLVNPPAPAGPEKWRGYDGNAKLISRPTLEPVKRFFRLGNPRGNENPFLLSMQVMWFRWHNVLASELKKQHPDWKDEKLFNEARKWVIASQQQIVLNEWLPHWIGENDFEELVPAYKGYDPSIDPQISHVFQSAAMRFGHTLVTAGGFKRSKDCSEQSIVRTCNNFWKSIDPLLNGGFDQLLMGLSSQPAEKEDNVIVEDLRGKVFGPLEFTRRDLMAINIQRGRDHGLPDYLSARRQLGLDKEDMSGKSISEIANLLWSETTKNDPSLIVKANKIFGNKTNTIDIWVGGMLETTAHQPGQLFRTIIADQFRHIRDADRFWFENERNGLFSEDEIERIKELSIYDVIRSVSNIQTGEIQQQPFRLPTETSNNNISPECQAKLTHRYDCVTNIKSNTIEKCISIGTVNKENTAGDKCTPTHTFDYFEGSKLSYTITFICVGIFIVSCILTLILLVEMKEKQDDEKRIQNSKRKRQTIRDDQTTLTQEWIGKDEGVRNVLIKMDNSNKRIIIKSDSEKELRIIDLKRVTNIKIISSVNRNNQIYLILRFLLEYDLVLKFDSVSERARFIRKLENFVESIGIGRDKIESEFKIMLSNAYTKTKRQQHLEKFFKVVFSHAFGVKLKRKDEIDVKTVKQVLSTELTQNEFAEAMSIRQDSLFIQQMFALVDKDNNGYISFREFLDMIVIFAKGNAEQKSKLMFDMYDVNGRGKLSVEEFKLMIKSLLELANQSILPVEMDQVIDSMFRSAGLRNRQELTFADFKKLLDDHKDELGYAELNFDVSSLKVTLPETSKRNSVINRANDTVIRAYSYFGGVPASVTTHKLGESLLSPPTIYPQPSMESLLRVEIQETTSSDSEWLMRWKRFAEENQLKIFWITIYTAILLIIFLDKAFYYTFLREDGGLRQIAGPGVTLTRGAASVMMFTFSTILLTMCRNIITFLRETFLNRFIPFDDAVAFHKYIAFWALLCSVIHSLGHALNFYHISTQNPNDLTCLFREYYHASHELPKFQRWCWQSITGVTGILLFCLLILIYVFAIHYSRRHVFNTFWLTHNLYPLLYILMTLHGMGRLIQQPILYYYLTIPLIIFIFDRLISVSRKKVEISVVRTILHPSQVTMIEFKRPPGFDYKSGQWVRIACLALNSNEYHPFTLASAPHEDNLALYIRAVGPFTKNLRQIYNPENLKSASYSKLYLDGPYGEGHQDWLRFEVSVLVGGGIGVTPFASILKDLAFRSSINQKIMCKKIYFLWVTRTQKHFEWMTDMIKDAEEKDKRNLLTTHIFITQFYEKFDLRTTMLYLCERHFQRISNKSLFTGLKAKTHFGRPDFKVFLDSLQQEHPNVSRVGVFSCGPNAMTASVQQACESLNRKDGAIFVHHFENF